MLIKKITNKKNDSINNKSWKKYLSIIKFWGFSTAKAFNLSISDGLKTEGFSLVTTAVSYLSSL